MRFFPYFDTHCDTLHKMYKENLHLDNRALEVSLEKLKFYLYPVLTFALFSDGTFNEKDTLEAFSLLRSECNRFGDSISFQTSALGIKRNFMKGKATALLAIEALGNQTDFRLECIKEYYRAGVRFISLCWNNSNQLCGGCDTNDGLTPLGGQTLSQMEQSGIILDVSHMSDKSFSEASEVYSLPFCATHSNSRHIQPHSRNLTDAQFISIMERDGLCSVSLYPLHLGGGGGIYFIIKHIEHFLSLGGENHVGIGADFDGMDCSLKDITHSGEMYKLFDALLSLNYKESLVEKIAFYNSYNFLRNFEISRRKSCNF